jgi:hypothetical protein
MVAVPHFIRTGFATARRLVRAFLAGQHACRFSGAPDNRTQNLSRLVPETNISWLCLLMHVEDSPNLEGSQS